MALRDQPVEGSEGSEGSVGMVEMVGTGGTGGGLACTALRRHFAQCSPLLPCPAQPTRFFFGLRILARDNSHWIEKLSAPRTYSLHPSSQVFVSVLHFVSGGGFLHCCSQTSPDVLPGVPSGITSHVKVS